MQKGLPGVYYSETQLKHAMGLSSHASHLYQLLRDGGRKESRSKAASQETDKSSPGAALETKKWGPAGDAHSAYRDEVGEDEEGDVECTHGHLSAIRWQPEAQALEGPTASNKALAADSARLIRSMGVSMADLCAKDRSVDEFAKIVVRQAVSQNLSVHAAMKRAVWQFEAVNGDHDELRCSFISILAAALNEPPQLRESLGAHFSEQHSAAAGKESEGEEEEEEEEENGEEMDSEKEERSDKSEVDLVDREAEKDTGSTYFLEKLGRDLTGMTPIEGLGDMGRGFWEDFDIPREAVMMQTNYSKPLATQFHSRHQLWLLDVLSRIFAVTIPIITCPEEVLFSSDVVRRGLPDVYEEKGRNMMLQALHFSEAGEEKDIMLSVNAMSTTWDPEGKEAESLARLQTPGEKDLCEVDMLRYQYRLNRADVVQNEVHTDSILGAMEMFCEGSDKRIGP